MNRNKQSGSLSLPASVIIAGALIAIALIWINKPATTGSQAVNQPGQPNQLTGIAPVSATDHILGNPNAPIKLVEYSDLSCPFCKLFSPTLHQVMNAYGPGGKVAWVYRHFPLFKPVNGQVLHPNSLQQAEALECAAQLGGTKAFFAFEKKWFEVFPDEGASRSASADRRQLDSVAKEVGIDPVSFNDCLSSGRFKNKIEKAYSDGLSAGITGTPYTVLITPSGSRIPLIGPQSYATLKATIDTLLTTIPNDIQN